MKMTGNFEIIRSKDSSPHNTLLHYIISFNIFFKTIYSCMQYTATLCYFFIYFSKKLSGKGTLFYRNQIEFISSPKHHPQTDRIHIFYRTQIEFSSIKRYLFLRCVGLASRIFSLISSLF
jgi:hypothetical protein